MAFFDHSGKLRNFFLHHPRISIITEHFCRFSISILLDVISLGRYIMKHPMGCFMSAGKEVDTMRLCGKFIHVEMNSLLISVGSDDPARSILILFDWFDGDGTGS